MRILLITPYFHPHKGGSQQYAEELYATLMQQDKSIKVDVLTYNTDNSKSVEEYKGFTIYRVPCKQILPGQFAIPNYVALTKLIQKLFAQNRYDFINSHTRFFETSWWTPFVASHYHTKSILTDHCASHPNHKTKFVTGISYLVDKFIAPFFINKYDYVTVTNKATQDFLFSLTQKKTDIIYGGVNTTLFKPHTRKNKRKILNIQKTFSNRDVVVSFVGRMIYSKGPDMLLKAAQKVTKKHKNVYFIFGGDGALYNTLSQSANSHIFFTGALDKDQVSKLFSQTDIVVHPSIHHEGFPNVILEAGSSGCAVIATSMGGTYEIINPKTGILVKPTIKAIESKIELLIKNRTMRLRLGRNLRNWISQKYEWKKIAKTYKTFLSESSQRKNLSFPSMRISGIPRN